MLNSLLNGTSLPKSTRILLLLLVAVALLIFFIKVNVYRSVSETNGDILFHDIQVPYLQLIPRYAIYYPWVILPAIFAEISVFSFIISFLVLLVSTKYVEKFWNYKEVVKFILVVGSITNTLTVLITIVANIVRGDVAGMDKPLGGGISYYFAFLVVLKQLIPEHNIILFQGLINSRVKHFPFILLISVLLWSALISRSLYPAVPSFGSFFVSYIYLRFYQSLATDTLLPITAANGESSQTVITGDASDTFKLVEFFPAIVRPYLAFVFDKVYELNVFLGIVVPFNDELVEQSNIRARKRQEQTNQVQKSVANSVAERRRQVALQVIEDRINKGGESRVN